MLGRWMGEPCYQLTHHKRGGLISKLTCGITKTRDTMEHQLLFNGDPTSGPQDFRVN